jgi:parvulin-like peptidyl-prolyl isomerase
VVKLKGKFRLTKECLKVRKFSVLIILTLLVAGQFSCSTKSKNSSGETTIAATVNGKPIKMEEVDRILAQQSGGQQSQLSPLELGASRLQVLESMIQQEVLYQKAEKEKLLPGEEEINQAINSQKQQNRMTEEEYRKMLKESNADESTLKEIAKKQIAVRKLQEKVAGKISISDKEVEEFYKNNRNQFVNTRGVGLADIVVDPTDNGLTDDAKSDAEAKQKIDIIYQQLKSGADFATVARAKSEDPSNIRGGDIGFATEEQLRENRFPSEVISKFFDGMQVGDVTGPIRFDTGKWYIFKLTSRQLKNENLVLHSPGVREQIKEALINQRRQLLNAALLSTAMNEARIENKLAEKMLNSPDNLSGLRPAPAGKADQSSQNKQ